MNIEIRPAAYEDTDAIADVLSQAALHKLEQGDYLWGSAPFEKEEVESMIEAGDFFVVTTNRLVSGTV